MPVEQEEKLLVKTVISSFVKIERKTTGYLSFNSTTIISLSSYQNERIISLVN